MDYAAHDLRDLFSLAKMLRRFAGDHACDNNRALFLDTAVALEARAKLMAEAKDDTDLEHEITLHAPVDLVA